MQSAEYEAESDAGLASLPAGIPTPTAVLYGGGGAEPRGDAEEGDANNDKTNNKNGATTCGAGANGNASPPQGKDGDVNKPTSMMPSDVEVAAYAEHLSMDPLLDAEFLYIAEWALTAPVPDGWSELLDDGGRVGTLHQLMTSQYRPWSM